MQRLKDSRLPDPDAARLLAYVADLELEVDRLRRHSHLVRQEARGAMVRIQRLCAESTAAGVNLPALGAIGAAVDHLGGVLHDLREVPGYHPSHDQVVAIPVRALTEQVFRWQQRLQGAPDAKLQMELESEHVEWFPARLRHILDNLVSNALRSRDPAKSETWVKVALRTSPESYELRVSDNGVGLPPDMHGPVFELFYRGTPARAAGLGMNLAVVKMLVEQSGGTLAVDSGAGQGTTFIAELPCFEVDDFLA